MKKFLLATVLATVGVMALGVAAPASAADLAPRPYNKAPPPVVTPIYDWTGFYIGGNGGWAQSRNCVDFFDVTGFDFADGCRDRSGGVVGGQVGYRWQSSYWVFGLEAQGDWADLSNTRISLIDPGFSTRTKTDGIGLFTGQVGYAWNATLLYFKGGAAVTSNRLSILDTLTGFEFASASSTRWGGTVGVGVEYGFSPNWSVVPNTTICSWVTRIIRSRSSIRLMPLFSTIGSARTWIWSPCASTTSSAITVTAARSSRNTDRASLLGSSSKLGRQKCRPFCWRDV